MGSPWDKGLYHCLFHGIKIRRMRTLITVIFAAAVASPLFAQSNEISILAGSTSVGSSEGIEFDNASAVGLAYNRFWTNLISTELSGTRSSHDGSLRFGDQQLIDLGSLDLTTIGATLQFHFINSGSLDVYAGPGIAYVSAGDLKSNDLAAAGITSVDIDTQTSWLVNAGGAFKFGHGVAIGVDGKYVHYEPDSSSAGGDVVALKLDPLTVGLTLKFHF